MSTRRLLLVWALLLAGIVCITQQPTSAYWQSRDSNYNIAISGGGGGYTGPIDINGTAYAFWSTRCGATAYTGNVADVWDTATGVTLETLITCSSGGVINTGSPTALATTCAVSCSVKTLYDQSGSNKCTTACDLTVNTAIPTLTISCQNGKLCYNFSDASTTCMSSPSVAATQAQPLTVSIVGNHTSSTGSGELLLLTSAGSTTTPQIGFPSGTQIFMFGNAQFNANMSTAAFHSTQALVNAASSSFSIDGSLTSGTSGATAAIQAAPMNVGGACFSRTNFTFLELGIWAADKTANTATMNSNQHTYWNF